MSAVVLAKRCCAGKRVKSCCTQEAEPSRTADACAPGARGAAEQAADIKLPDQIQLVARRSAAAKVTNSATWSLSRRFFGR